MGLLARRLQASRLCRTDNCNSSERSSRRFFKATTSNEAPYQMLGRRTLAATIGHKEVNASHFWLSVISECLSCFLYVFVVCSTRISWTGAIIGHEPNIVAMALSSGIAMALLTLVFRTVHVNPALSVAFMMTGRIPVIRCMFYVIAQSVGGIAAAAFLHMISVKGHAGALGLDNPHEILTPPQVLIVEFVISFVVTIAVFATCSFSSYRNAKKLILEQLGQSSNLLNAPSLAYDYTSVQRRSRRSVAPIVPQPPSTSINIMKSDQSSNSTSNHENNFAAQPYVISNHYDHVYGEDYLAEEPHQHQQVMMNNNNHHTIANRPIERNNNRNMIVNSNNSKSTHLISMSSGCNSDEIRREDIIREAKSRQEVADMGSRHIVSEIERLQTLLCNKTQERDAQRANMTKDPMWGQYGAQSAVADYDLLNSNVAKCGGHMQVPIEELIEDESQLLAPNGYSMKVTASQALVIGLAYTLTSLSGIPASGASLNPARSLGPAFIMNRWDNHWIYWLGPIMGAVIAGLFHEFIFSPTRKSSLCYRPKLFRLSAQDMAAVGSKSRLNQQRKQQIHTQASQAAAAAAAAAAASSAAGLYNQSGSQISPSTSSHERVSPNSHALDPTSFTHRPVLAPAFMNGGPHHDVFDQANQQFQSYQNQQQQQQLHKQFQTQPSRVDRCKSANLSQHQVGPVNTMSYMHHQSYKSQMEPADLASLMIARRLDLQQQQQQQQQQQAVYDEPRSINTRLQQCNAGTLTRRSYVPPPPSSSSKHEHDAN